MNQIQQFDQLKADITLKLAPSLQIKVTDKPSMNNALLAGKEAKHFEKLVEEKRKELVAPLNAEVKRINDYAKSILEPVHKTETHIKSELRGYEMILEEERQAEKKRLEQELNAKQKELESKKKEEAERLALAAEFGADDENQLKRDEIVANATIEREQAEILKDAKTASKLIDSNKVSGTTKFWTFKVTDPLLVPREYLVVDETKIRKAMNAGLREIAGVEFSQETRMSLR